MRIRKLALGALLGLSPLFAQAAPTTLSRQDLLKGSKIPEKRDYPVNPDVKPCENFYEYVCSKVRDDFKLPDDRSHWTFAFTDASERLLDAKKNFFRELDKGYVPKSERAKQTRDYYKACMNSSARAGEERARLQSEKKLILGLKSNEELADLAQNRIDKPGDTFLAIFDLANQADPLQIDIAPWADWKTLPERSYYHKKEVMKDFEAMALKLFQTAGVDRAAQRAKWVAKFETELADATPLPAEIRERFSEDRYLAASDWVKKYPHLKLDRILAKIPAKTKLRLVSPESFDFFEKAIANRSLDELKSVYLFHSLHEFMDDAYPQYYAKRFELNRKHFGGPPKRPDRQERCTKETMRNFSMELDEELIATLFPDFPEKKVEDLVNKIRASLLAELEQNKWLTKQARAEAKRKIAEAHMFLVKPKRDQDWNFNLPAKYDPNEPLANRDLFRQKEIEKLFQEMPRPRNRDRWEMGPLVLNAYYDGSDNKFVMLQGILQYPFFDPSRSELENIAAIGTIVGHELGHSIDDEGSKYNADGKLQTWMTEADTKEFKRRGEAMVKLFDSIGHNGKLTLGENIGDHVGLTASHAAAFPDAKKSSVEDEQKFFISYARVWCYKSRPGSDEEQLKTDPHSLGSARVNQQVIQLPAFAKAFSCQAGDKMHVPEKDQIRIW